LRPRDDCWASFLMGLCTYRCATYEGPI
jgi:hypothetical protein